MNIYQLLADGSCFVGMGNDTRWVGPFRSENGGKTAFELANQWCVDNRVPGSLIRSRGLLRAPPDDWNTPEGERQGDAMKREAAAEKARATAEAARITAERVEEDRSEAAELLAEQEREERELRESEREAAEAEEREALREGENNEMSKPEPRTDLIEEIIALSVPKMGKRLPELTHSELLIAKVQENRSTALRAIDAWIDRAVA